MINYRQIFNPQYNYIGIIIILILILIIYFIQKNIFTTIKQINKIFQIVSTLMLIITLILNLIIDKLLIANYKIFIEIITKNIINNLYFYSITTIIISIFIMLIIKIFTNYYKNI